MGKLFKVFSDHKPLGNENIKSRTDEELGEDTPVLPDELKENGDSNHLENDREIAFENSMRNQDYNYTIKVEWTTVSRSENLCILVYVENGNRLNVLRMGLYKILK
ncbi:hypothetical protein HHI36_024227 [Cryptolaemus montrouzieri]|uniref:Uncharacterized protein n=1 Tax=Cryptolaemus montrouzieri TaxID=559131 RepID=A0ABD2P3L8_9CUCU